MEVAAEKIFEAPGKEAEGPPVVVGVGSSTRLTEAAGSGLERGGGRMELDRLTATVETAAVASCTVLAAPSEPLSFSPPLLFSSADPVGVEPGEGVPESLPSSPSPRPPRWPCRDTYTSTHNAIS